MFISALGSVSGESNRLALRRVDRAAVVLVDGLGTANLKAAGGHAPYLNSLLSSNPSIACGFPSTTAASITSFATGLQAGEHGIVGYQVFDRQTNRQANLLSGWGPEQDPLVWQPNKTVTERALEANIPSFVIGPDEYRDSGFTRATMRGATYLPERTIEGRFDRLEKVYQQGGKALVYCYIPELDQAAHAKGVDSDAWLRLIEEVDSQVKRLAAKLTSQDGLLVTADHGVVDVKSERHIVLDELIEWPADSTVSGDPRVCFVYCQSEPESLLNRLRDKLAGSAVVASREEVVEAGLYGSEVESQALSLLPDIFVIATAQVAIYHRSFSKPQSFKMVGQHGALSAAELQIPLIRLGGYVAR